MNNGLLYSSVNEKSSVKARGDYADKVAETNLRFENEKSAVDAEQTAAQNVYEQSLASIESERQSKLDDVLSDLRENEEKTRLNVEKYNNSLQEKEIKYQASREKALEAAREAEYDRAYKMAKLLAEIGETGIKEKVLLEKYHICQNSFRTLRRNEAKTLLNVDAFYKPIWKILYDIRRLDKLGFNRIVKRRYRVKFKAKYTFRLFLRFNSFVAVFWRSRSFIHI